MGKFNFDSTLKKIHKSLEGDEARIKQFGLGDSLESISTDPKDYVVLPEWFKKYYGIMGLPFGKWVQISGKPDAGKTSLALLSIRCAQEQGFGVVYAETETKTSTEDLILLGIDPKGIFTNKTNITEEVFDNVKRNIEAFFNDYPKEKLLLAIDSFGNTTSQRDAEMDLTKKGAKVGGAALINRLGLSQIRALQNQYPIAVLIVNYSYANLGSHGETNSGGRALEFFCSLIIQAKRKAHYERVIRGIKVRAGTDVGWTTTKNHFTKTLRTKDGKPLLLPKELVLRISAEGMIPQEKNE